MNDTARRISYIRRLAATGAARAMRENAQLSIRELARSIGTAPSTLHRWEAGSNVPRARAALAWLDTLEGLGR